jgi:hypothetical protein
MMNIEFKVNGALVGNIYLHNEGYTGEDDQCLYKWHAYSVGESGEPVLEGGTVTHSRGEGMFGLVEKICSEIRDEP